MHHPRELSLHKYMLDVSNQNATMSEVTIKQVSSDIEDALRRQFGSNKKSFAFRMSNIGKPYCQLWFDKNKPETALPKPNTFIMNMMIGDIVEAVFKGLLKEAGVEYKNSSKVTLQLSNADISGTYDIIIDGAVDDIKSASDWSYKNKFESFDSLSKNDGFGYIGQLAGYAKASKKKIGGWWVVNKGNGQFKYVPADIDIEKEISILDKKMNKLIENKFERSFEEEEELFRSKPTGNKILCKTCSFCSYRKECWSTLQELPSLVSKAQNKKTVPYTYIGKEYKNG